jgi:hypothetical protein
VTRAVFLVPRRDGFRDRDELWRFCRAYWTRVAPEIELFEGHHDEGLFNRSAAINRAAAAAGSWDVGVVLDSDVLADPELVREAIVHAAATGRMVVAFDVRHDLSRAGTARVVDGFSGSWSKWIERDHYDQHSGIVAIPRALFDQVGGFDEAFEGWGYEDTAFAIAAEAAAGPRVNLPGDCWHLHHARAPEARAYSPSWSANRRRRDEYAAAAGDLPRILSLRSLEISPVDDTRIPRIFHRVIPEKPNATAERYWRELGKLHPGWTLKTWRDPLPASEFPESAAVWDRCDSGASLSDLVRLEALLRFGGVFVDWDCRPLRSFEPLLALDAFAAFEDAKVVPNAVLGAKPYHVAIRECLDRALRAVVDRRGTWSGGPGVTTAVLPGRADVLVLPSEAFYPVDYRDPDRERKMAAFDSSAHPASFVLHEYWGSWLEPERRRVPEEPKRDLVAALDGRDW